MISSIARAARPVLSSTRSAPNLLAATMISTIAEWLRARTANLLSWVKPAAMRPDARYPVRWAMSR
jgi:hypothetical protein